MEQLEKIYTQVSKRCPRCQQEKPAEDFYRDSTTRDGLRCYCIVCWLDYVRRTGYRYQYKYMRARREHYTELERLRYHRTQEEAGCHLRTRVFYPGFRFLRALASAEVIEV